MSNQLFFPPSLFCARAVVPQRPCTAHLSPATKSWLDWGMTETLQDINICFKPFLCGFGFLFQSFLRWKINLLNHGSFKKKEAAADFPLGNFLFYCIRVHVSASSIYTAWRTTTRLHAAVQSFDKRSGMSSKIVPSVFIKKTKLKRSSLFFRPNLLWSNWSNTHQNYGWVGR